VGALQERLTGQGYRVATADDCDAALSGLAEAPDLVIADLRLSSPAGEGLLGALRRCGRRVPVVVLTGHGRMDDAVEALRAAATDFVEKPIHFRALDASVRGALADVGRERPARPAVREVHRTAEARTLTHPTP